MEQPVLEPVPAPLVEPISDENSSSVPPTTLDSNGSKGDNGDQGQEGKPSVPVVWVHSDDEITIKSAAISLLQMQN